MDFGLNNERKNKRNHFLNIIFLGIFLAEIIIYIIGIVILPIRTDWLISFASVFFVSGIYTFFKKTLLYLLAFCVVNIIQCIILIDIVQYFTFGDVTNVTLIARPDVVKKFLHGIGEKEYKMTLIIPNIIAGGLIIFFVLLYIILIIMMWKNKYWYAISRTNISILNMPSVIKKSYITYKFYNFLLYIILYLIVVWNLIGMDDSLSLLKGTYGVVDLLVGISITVTNFLSLFTLTLSLIIIKKELKCSVFLIYIALILQFIFFFFMANHLLITGIFLLTLSGLTLINTILCHRNFGKNFIFYVESMKFNPNLDKEFEYSNDLDDDDDDGEEEEEEEEEKDEKISEKLKRYWKFIKKTFYDVFISLIEE
ncbi:unnamed protein product [Rhizophagus irregularis]|nr:unnamed protein product [Rhizophagus irregularis]